MHIIIIIALIVNEEAPRRLQPDIVTAAGTPPSATDGNYKHAAVIIRT